MFASATRLMKSTKNYFANDSQYTVIVMMQFTLFLTTYRVHGVFNLLIHIIQSVQSIDGCIAFFPYEVVLKCLTILVQETHQFILVRSKNTNLHATSQYLVKKASTGASHKDLISTVTSCPVKI